MGADLPVSKPTLLIVDDERRFLESMKKLLSKRGINVIAMDNGEKAVRMVRGYPVDVAVLDLKMPGMSGLETLQALKNDTPDLEVVILSGHGSDQVRQTALDQGAFTFLPKPCSLEQILSAAAGALRKRWMRKKNLDDQQMNQLLRDRGIEGSAPLETLRYLKTLDKETQSPDGFKGENVNASEDAKK